MARINTRILSGDLKKASRKQYAEKIDTESLRS